MKSLLFFLLLLPIFSISLSIEQQKDIVTYIIEGQSTTDLTVALYKDNVQVYGESFKSIELPFKKSLTLEPGTYKLVVISNEGLNNLMFTVEALPEQKPTGNNLLLVIVVILLVIISYLVYSFSKTIKKKTV